MTRKEAIEMINESLIDQDSKFSREIKALFKQQEVVDLLQNAYDMADDNAKMSLMDATEKQFLDKFAKDGSGDDEETEKKENGSDDSTETDDDFLLDGSGLDDETGSDDDFDTSIDDGSDDGSDGDLNDTTPDDNGDSFDMGGDDSNPFADFGGGNDTSDTPQEPSNPFESLSFRTRRKTLNESVSAKKVLHRRKK